MPACESCGCLLSDTEPFSVCPRCLFQAALAVPPVPGPARMEPVEGAPSAGTPPDGGLDPWLTVRGDFIERYEVQRRRAQGGQGEILEVWDLRLRRTLAMKRLGRGGQGEEAAAARARFLAEAQITGQLQHPGILPIHDVGIDPDGRPFYTTDLLPGTTLADLFAREARRPVDERVRATLLDSLIRVCEIVGHAHSRGVIHRDLKPGNVLAGEFGDVRVIDWGSAHVVAKGVETPGRAPTPDSRDGTGNPRPIAADRIQTDRSETLRRDPASALSTSASGQPLTLLYAPPETLEDPDTSPDPTTDVYAVGVMLYEVCTGWRPFADPGGDLPEAEELKRRICEAKWIPMRELDRRIPPDLAAICAKAMARDRTARYPTLEGLSDDLRAFLETRPVSARPMGLLGTFHKWLRRHTLPVVWASFGLALLGVALAVAFRLDAERRRVDLERRQAIGEQHAAVQTRALRESDLAAREGRWRDALDRLRLAEEAGYADTFELALRRSTAWIVLWEPEAARKELERLSDGAGEDRGRRALATLRRGEFELFDAASYDDGIRHVREALELGLDRVEATFASGVLAESTAEALAQFKGCLALQPYHHAAHRYALGLEMLTGQHEALASHAEVFRGLFPGDPTPAFAQAMAAAFQGDLAGAERAIAPYRETLGEEAATGIRSMLELFSGALALFDVEYALGDRTAPAFDVGALQKRLGAVLLGGPAGPAVKDPRFGRLPSLPCIRSGVQQGSTAILSLALAPGGPTSNALPRIRRAWAAHREALIPFGAALVLESRRAADAPASAEFAQALAELFDMAAQSFSVIPKLPRLARYRAARAHFDLVRRGESPHIAACLNHLRQAAAESGMSTGELREYTDLALQLREFSLAAEFLGRWERSRPNDSVLRRRRIEFLVADGTLGPALELLERVLAENPTDVWAQARRDAARTELRRLASTLPPAPSNPHPIPSKP